MKSLRKFVSLLLLLALCVYDARAGNLGLLSVSGPATAAAGASVSYTVKLFNGGSEDTNAKLTMRLDPNVTFSSATAPTGWTCTGPTVGQNGTVTCTNSTYKTTRYWTESEAVVLNVVRYPTTPNGHLYKVTTAGTTGSAEPSWPTGAGSTVTDGSVTWTEVGTDAFTVNGTVVAGTTLWTWLNTVATVSFTPTVSSPPDPNAEDDRLIVATRVNG